MKYFPFGESRNSQGTIATDRLFTGQRLDSTGLYYYGARYYDASIGRFISPDSIVPDPLNPQSLNSYSYCLNNPLKYIDPTGHYGEGLGTPYANGALGYTSAEGWLIGSGGQWYPVSGEAVDVMVSSYQRSSANTWTEFMSNIVPSFIPGNNNTITSENLPAHMWAMSSFEMNNQTFVWGVQYRFNSEKYTTEPQLTLIADYEITTHDWIVVCDALAVGGDAVSFIPGLGPIGYGISVAGSGISYGITVNEYYKGNMTEHDMFVAHISFFAGLVPYVGIFPAGRQFVWDVWSK